MATTTRKAPARRLTEKEKLEQQRDALLTAQEENKREQAKVHAALAKIAREEQEKRAAQVGKIAYAHGLGGWQDDELDALFAWAPAVVETGEVPPWRKVSETEEDA